MVSKYIEQKWTELQEEIERCTSIMGDLENFSQ